jgi:hypothetical protein
MKASHQERHLYGMAPQIRFTLLVLYAALVLPLPSIAPAHWQPLLWGALAFGLLIVLAITSEQVILDHEGVQLCHPSWCRWWLRRGWQLQWAQVEGLTPMATSQGGRVFYVRSRAGHSPGAGQSPQSFLLPQRVERFDAFLTQFSALSGVPTDSVVRITPAWTYQLLAAMSVTLLVGEVIALAGFQPTP